MSDNCPVCGAMDATCCQEADVPCPHAERLLADARARIEALEAERDEALRQLRLTEQMYEIQTERVAGLTAERDAAYQDGRDDGLARAEGRGE